MKRICLTIACIMVSVASIMAQDIETRTSDLGHGYRAFVEIEGLSDGIGKPLEIIDITTTHGYQFNPHFYAGVGAGIAGVIGGFPKLAFADFRYENIGHFKYSPYFALRIFSFDKFKNGYIRPSIGFRYKHLNLNAGYWLTKEQDNFFSIGLGLDFGGRKKKK